MFDIFLFIKKFNKIFIFLYTFIAIYRMIKDKRDSMRYIIPIVPIAIRCDLSAHDRIVTIILHIVPALPLT